MYTQINGQQIYYQSVGKGKNLIMLHGWGQDVSTFWPDLDYLKDDLTIWLIDLPGFGRSEPPKEKYDSGDYAKIIAEFIKKNGIKNVTILGHSFGGKVAIRVASEYPKLVDKLILVGASGLKPYASLKKYISFILAKIIKHTLPNFFNFKSKIRKDFYRKIESDYADAGRLRGVYLKTIREDLTEYLKKIDQQTLIIWGDQDRAVPLKYGKKMYQLIKNSKMVILEDKGHFLHIHDPERFTSYVKDFV